MEPAHVALALAGAVAGLVASAVPGLHVNALAAVALAVAPAAGAPGAVFLVAAFAASPFGLAISSPFTGSAHEDGALQALPAAQLAREGRAAEAIALQAWGALAGIVTGAALALLVGGIVARGADELAAAMPWILLAIVALLVAGETARPRVHARRVVVPYGGPGVRTLAGALSRADDRLRVGARDVEDPQGLLDAEADGAHVEVRVETLRARGPLSAWVGRAAALGVLGASGALGLAALPLGASSPFALPASPLLPLLAGLFAIPALAAGLRDARRPPRVRLRPARPPRGELARACVPGALASSVVGLAPGLSASHAALLLPRARNPEAGLARMAAVGGGAIAFTILAWHALGKARSGALVAAEAWAPPEPWRAAAPPDGLLGHLAIALVAALAAFALARALAPAVARAAARLAPRTLAVLGIALVVTATFAFTGGLGLLMLATSACVGALPHRWGVRRGCAMGVILVPALLRAWGFA